MLIRSATLWSALTAQEKGFGGAGVVRSRGLWLGILRAPCMRLLALLLAASSVWLATAELCATTRLLPHDVGREAFARCPMVVARASLQAHAPLLVLLDAATLATASFCCVRSLAQSALLAGAPLLGWRATDSYSLLQHAAWAARLTAPFASHFAFITGAETPGLVVGADEFTQGVGSLLSIVVAAMATSGSCVHRSGWNAESSGASRFKGTRSAARDRQTTPAQASPSSASNGRL